MTTRRRRFLRGGIMVGLAALLVGLLSAAGHDDPEAPDALTARGRACMESLGFDAGALSFVSDIDGNVGYTSDVTNDMRELARIVPRIGNGGTDPYAALRSCVGQLKQQIAEVVPTRVAVDPVMERAILDCIASAPNADQLIGSVTIDRWDDGRMAIEYAYPDLGPEAQEALTRAAARCLPSVEH